MEPFQNRSITVLIPDQEPFQNRSRTVPGIEISGRAFGFVAQSLASEGPLGHPSGVDSGRRASVKPGFSPPPERVQGWPAGIVSESGAPSRTETDDPGGYGTRVG